MWPRARIINAKLCPIAKHLAPPYFSGDIAIVAAVLQEQRIVRQGLPCEAIARVAQQEGSAEECRARELLVPLRRGVIRTRL